jgi:hypothetical protein
MPHDSDVQPTSHARHDVLLVAALAAGDLSGTDRDHATALIETCPECMGLHDDLIVIARATAAAPPPIVTRPRDFRLTPEEAAHLRPGGWRRALGAFAGPRLAFTRPLGIAMTTIGLAGLLITNIPLGLGGSAASVGAPAVPASRNAANDVTGEGASSGDGTTSLGPVAAPAASAPAASSAAGALAASPAPVASAAPAAAGSAAPRSISDGSVRTGASQAVGSVQQAAGGPEAQPSAAPDTTMNVSTETAPAPDLRTLFFVAVVLVGLGLLVLRRVGRRITPA